ncbi:hypothetical protein AVEN_86440-1 [Araneus ventricosus]|uniref:Uncharacterized protein n=1 Tax=Araneus ventricosus TaxID=182803 RepID=A0A4Y2QYB8_ARAVE|nr:hypothetical protein AVEN_86440-1 [Araneus ventricosus]
MNVEIQYFQFLDVGPRTAAVEELVPTSIIPLNYSSHKCGILKDQSRRWKIFSFKGRIQPALQEKNLQSDSFTPTISFLLQIEITSGRSRKCQFSAIITASSLSSSAQ